MIELKGITKKYGAMAVVKDVSFKVSTGEVLGYLGPNGAGKTTTIKILAGLLDATDGEILCDGVNIKKDIIAFKKRLGYVPEQSEIYPHLSAYDYLLLVGRLRRLKEKSLKEKIERFMELFSLANDMHAAISSYSKGCGRRS
jgi:ABC-2 type transport system ATP-binding protein